MFQRAFEDVRDDFHVTVRVLRKPPPPRFGRRSSRARCGIARARDRRNLAKEKVKYESSSAVVGVAAFFAF